MLVLGGELIIGLDLSIQIRRGNDTIKRVASGLVLTGRGRVTYFTQDILEVSPLFGDLTPELAPTALHVPTDPRLGHMSTSPDITNFRPVQK